MLLEHAPIEWDESALRWKRSTLYGGLTREFSLPFEFVKEGAKLLRSYYYTEGVEASAELIVEAYKSLTEAYVEVYRGQFDFSTFMDREDSVQCSMADQGVESKIKAREAVVYEYDLEDAAYTIKIPKISTTTRGLGTVFSIPTLGRAVAPAVVVKGQNFNPGTVSLNDASPGGYASISDLMILVNGAHFLTSYDSLLVRAGVSLRIGNVRRYLGQPTHQFKILDSEGNVYGTRVITGDGDWNLKVFFFTEPGRRYFLILESLLTNPLAMLSIESPTISADLSSITVSYTEEVEDFEVKAFRVSDIFKRLISSMAGETYAPVAGGNTGNAVERRKLISRSTLLTQAKDLYVTSGDGIRGLEDAKLKTNFNDFYKSMKSVLAASFGVDKGVAVMERFEYFYNPSLETYNVGSVKEVEIRPASEYMYSLVKVGYEDQDYNEDLGREEFNTLQEYSTPLTREANTLDLVSPYRADHFGIDEARLEGLASNIDGKDSKTDNDVFLIFANPTPVAPNTYKAQTSGDFEEVYGLSGRDNIINLSISPKRNLLRQGGFLTGSVFPLLGIFKFESAAKDVNLISKIGGEEVRERSNVFTGSLPGPSFLPVIASVTTSIGAGALEFLKNRPTGVITFKFRGALFKGFILGAEANLTRSAEVELELLLSPQSDLSKLID